MNLREKMIRKRKQLWKFKVIIASQLRAVIVYSSYFLIRLVFTTKKNEF
jgi:hypothetical protein